jgi:hypothetical protein
MYRSVFGTVNQVRFSTPQDYYEFLGFLARNDGTTEIVWEDNDEQGAWGPEGRIHFRIQQPPNLRVRLSHTAGRGNAILTRVNCNAFVEHIIAHHAFTSDGQQNQATIRATIPHSYLADFDRGLTI